MIKEMLGDLASAALAKSLEGTSQRQNALASNVANAETPGYVRQDVDFRGALSEAVDSALNHPHDAAATIGQVDPRRISDTSRPPNADGNNVNIEHEMAELARNSLEFDGSARMLSLKIRMLRAAISEGRK